MSTTSSIPQGSTVLVTGANSYLGSHVTDQLLLAGYKVRGTVRDANKAKRIQEVFEKRHGAGKFEAVVVPDMSVEGAYDEAIKGVSAVAHVASNLSMNNDPRIVIPESVNGALNALRSAAKQPSVKRVVVTSSSAAVSIPVPNRIFEVTPEMFNEEAIKAAWDSVETPPAPNTKEAYVLGVIVYAASKTEAEKACWKFVEEEKPGFELSTVLPNLNFGPVLGPENVKSSGKVVDMVLNGAPEVEHYMAAVVPQYFIDVRDTGRLHVAALTNPTVKSERIFAYAEPFQWTSIFSILRKAYPDRPVHADIQNEPKDLTTVKTRARSIELLKALGQNGFISLEDSLKANAESIL